MLKNEDNNFQNLLKLKIAFSKFLKNKDLKNPLKIVKKMKTALCAGSPMAVELRLRLEHYLEMGLENSLLCGKITKQASESATEFKNYSFQ